MRSNTLLNGTIKNEKNKTGATIVGVVFIIVFLAKIGVTFSYLIVEHHYSYKNILDTTQGFYCAEAGIEWALKKGTGSGGPKNFAGGTFDVTVTGSEMDFIIAVDTPALEQWSTSAQYTSTGAKNL